LIDELDRTSSPSKLYFARTQRAAMVVRTAGRRDPGHG
jgi:hypothetical protein